jgi:hypothetical protein
MIFLPERTVRQNIKKFGFQTLDHDAFTELNSYLEHFVANSIKKLQKGGRIVLPSEYFGSTSGSYVDAPSHTNMAVSETLIRPAILTQDLTGAIKGGAPKKDFSISKAAFNKAVAATATKVPSQHCDHLRQKAELLFTQLFKKIEKTNPHVETITLVLVKDVSKQQNFKSFHAKHPKQSK